MSALTIDAAKNVGLLTTIGLVVLAVVALWTITAVLKRIVTVALLVALALVVWSQRTEVRDCGKAVQTRIELGASGPLTCTFFGKSVHL